MRNYLAIIMVIFISYSMRAQNDDITIDANNNTIPNSQMMFKGMSVESLTDFFYKNISNIKEIDKIMSYKFYQTTPFKEFSKLIESKNTQFGKFISKEVIKVEYSNDKHKATIFLKVKYSKVESKEQIVFLKEFEKDSYNIVEYFVQ
ncbi:hypothetical protein [Flavobacterium sp.]|uniref:hypothetical protein n=1 Tax=Flavobacterium sp. TaxID=239 RepID=UPI002632EC58|nr:hypothetical protein [Flavobacterium sp.]